MKLYINGILEINKNANKMFNLLGQKNTTRFSETDQNNIKTKKKSEAFLEKENGSRKYSLA